METFKNIIRSYRQKFANVAAEIYKVSYIQLYGCTFYYFVKMYLSLHCLNKSLKEHMVLVSLTKL